MAGELDFKVTRSGRDVYTGALEGLVEAAAAGRIRANDLVYDPAEDKWVFARALPALAGFALKGRRARGTETHEKAGPITLDSYAIERQRERRLVLLRAVGFLVLLGVTLALVSRVGGGDKRAYSEFIEERDKPEGEVRAPAGGEAGRAGGATAGGGAAGPGAGGPAAPSAAGASPQAATPRATTPSATGSAGGATRAAVDPPAELLFDYAQRDAPGVFVEPTADERARYAARYTSEGMRALTRPDPPPGDARLAELLAARHRAEFAKLNLEALDPEHPDIAQVDQLIADLERAFDAVCRPAYGERFCGLKLQYPDWPDAVIERVAAGQVEVGMSVEQAREAWGRPSRFRREGDGRRFCYDFLCDRSLLVVDRVVTEIAG